MIAHPLGAVSAHFSDDQPKQIMFFLIFNFFFFFFKYFYTSSDSFDPFVGSLVVVVVVECHMCLDVSNVHLSQELITSSD